MIQVSNEDELRQFKEAFYKIFKSNDPFGEMFQDLIEERMILCPLDGFYLTKFQFDALIESMNAVQDDKINVSEVEAESDCFSIHESDDKYQCHHWKLTKHTLYDEYMALPIIVENAIYSPKGKWGILISHEGHAVIGGTSEFLEAFKAHYPLWDEGLKNFERQWNYNKNEYRANIDWIPKLICHINNE